MNLPQPLPQLRRPRGFTRFLCDGAARIACRLESTAFYRMMRAAPRLSCAMLLACACLFVAACSPASPEGPAAQDGGSASEEPAAQDAAAQEEGEPAPDPLGQRVAEAMEGLSLEQKVAQMFIVRPTDLDDPDATIKTDGDEIGVYSAGGVLYGGDRIVDPEQTRELTSFAMERFLGASGIPGFICIDEEGGDVVRIGGNEAFGIRDVGAMRWIGEGGDVQLAHDEAVFVAEYLREYGFNVDFAPVADITNGDSDTMYTRSFGSDGKSAAAFVAAQVRGFNEAGVICSAKHFPGIGAAEGDSHEDGITTWRTLDQMRDDELLPFESAIAEGVPMVMVGHINTPEVTADGLPASFSKGITTGLLRGELGYEGVIITDSLGMGAAMSVYGDEENAIAAILAGADICLQPADFATAYKSVVGAVEDGRISEARIDESVERILRLKFSCL